MTICSKMEDESYYSGRLDPEETKSWNSSDLHYYVELNIFEQKTVKDHIALAPYWLSDPLKGVSEDLKESLGRWKPSLDGYLVAYEDIKYAGTDIAELYVDQPWFHIDFEATFYTYKPCVDQLLKGTIQKVGDKAALCVVYNCFSATVYPRNQGELWQWLVGNEIDFRITSVQNRRKGPVILAKSCGDQVDSGSTEVVLEEEELWESLPSPKKNQPEVVLEEEELWESVPSPKKNQPEFDQEHEEPFNSESVPKKKKKKKKDKHKEQECSDDIVVIRKSKKHSKRKHEEVVDDEPIESELPKKKKKDKHKRVKVEMPICID